MIVAKTKNTCLVQHRILQEKKAMLMFKLKFDFLWIKKNTCKLQTQKSLPAFKRWAGGEVIPCFF